MKCFAFFCALGLSGASLAGFVEKTKGENRALLVSSGSDLPGLDLDIEKLQKISESDEYAFRVFTLDYRTATPKRVRKELTGLSKAADTDGTFLFYFTGHGTEDTIWLEEEPFTTAEIAKAISDGRKKPLARLVLIFDACHSGSFKNDFRKILTQEEYMAKIIQTFSSVNRSKKYWKKLIVYTSTAPDELCPAGDKGSPFTNAFAESFHFTAKKEGTLGEFFKRVKEKYKDSTPQSRYVPSKLEKEKVFPD